MKRINTTAMIFSFVFLLSYSPNSLAHGGGGGGHAGGGFGGGGGHFGGGHIGGGFGGGSHPGGGFSGAHPVGPRPGGGFGGNHPIGTVPHAPPGHRILPPGGYGGHVIGGYRPPFTHEWGRHWWRPGYRFPILGYPGWFLYNSMLIYYFDGLYYDEYGNIVDMPADVIEDPAIDPTRDEPEPVDEPTPAVPVEPAPPSVYPPTEAPLPPLPIITEPAPVVVDPDLVDRDDRCCECYCTIM